MQWRQKEKLRFGGMWAGKSCGGDGAAMPRCGFGGLWAKRKECEKDFCTEKQK